VDHTTDLLSADLLDGKLHLRKEDFDPFKDPTLTVKFLKFQWDYIAPLWGYVSSSHKVLSPRSILTFAKAELVSEGGFGRAFIVTLKSTHQGFFGCTNTGVGLVNAALIHAAILSFSVVIDLRLAGGADVSRSIQRMYELWKKSPSITGAIQQISSVNGSRIPQDFKKETMVHKLL
jgi:hypothetical protein